MKWPMLPIFFPWYSAPIACAASSITTIVTDLSFWTLLGRRTGLPGLYVMYGG